MQNNNVKAITFTGMFAALIFVTTWALHIPTGFNGGYIHIGDAFIYLAAVMLPPPFAMAASAIGAGLSDFMTPGAAVWILPTVIIKPLCCLPFTAKSDKLLCKRNILATLVAGVITILGYGVAGAVITRSIPAAVAEAPFQLIQSTGSAACFVVISVALGRTSLKKLVEVKGK